MYCFKKLSSFILVISLVFCASAMGAPRLLNYQGTLADGGIPVSGIKEMPMSFKICETETGETFRWNSGNITVTVVNGVFSVTLNGEKSGNEFPADLFTNDTLYIAVFVDEKEILPRKRVASVPFALNVVGSSGTSGIPSGVIVMWSGSADNLPPGWALCDGKNDTPDLRDRFIVGAGIKDAGAEYGTGDTGGVKFNNLAHNHSFNHAHTISLETSYSGEHKHCNTKASGCDDGFSEGGSRPSNVRGGHTHTVSGSTSNHTSASSNQLSETVENRPPYFALCFIMKL